MKNILVTAVFQPEGNYEVYLFWAKYHGPDFPKSLSAAFREWSETQEGSKYIRSNGTNWGDACEIPNLFLNKHGIETFDSLFKINESGQMICEVNVFDQHITVEHDDELIRDERIFGGSFD